ncbi:MAG: single-stranded DNA-binding protein [Patescibacteria group bacterium]
MDLNRASLLGRLTRDPEIRTTPNGKTVANMTIATNRVWTDSAGARQEKTEFSNCVLWGRLAEIAGQYLSKGQQVYLEGRLETRDWVGNDGVKRYRTEVIVRELIMLGGRRSGAAAPAGESFSDGAPVPTDVEIPSIDLVEEEVKVEDIPF